MSPMSRLSLFTWTLLSMCTIASATPRPPADYILDYQTPLDQPLQAQLQQIDRELRAKYDMTQEHTAVGVLDLAAQPKPRLAMVRPDREEYAASLPNIGILLAYFIEHPEAATSLDPQVRRELGEMAKQSSNEMADKYSRQIGLKRIQAILNQYGFYDAEKGGGLWAGKHYGKGDERYGSPVGDNSHAATVRQLLRYWLLLEQGKLVSPEASQTMREIFASPDLKPDDIKFVKALADRPGIRILRKWGSWQDWLHDTAVVTGPDRYYILVALTRHPRGDAYLEDLARAIDELMQPKATQP